MFQQFDCTIHKGEYIGFQGYSGAGKSTLFNLLLGLLKPDAGRVLIDGIPLEVSVRSSWLKRIGYVPQDVFIFQGTLAENIALGCKDIDQERVQLLLHQVSLEQWAESLPIVTVHWLIAIGLLRFIRNLYFGVNHKCKKGIRYGCLFLCSVFIKLILQV